LIEWQNIHATSESIFMSLTCIIPFKLVLRRDIVHLCTCRWPHSYCSAEYSRELGKDEFQREREEKGYEDWRPARP
jgi:hypothetical protein